MCDCLIPFQVSIIFHVAATVNFTQAFKDAVMININGTRCILHLAKRMQNLKVKFCNDSKASNNACSRAHTNVLLRTYK